MEQREDAVGDLLRMLQGAGSDADLLSRLETDIGGMVRRLPPEVRSAVEDTVLRAAIDRDHSALIAGVDSIPVRTAAGRTGLKCG